MKTRLLSVLLVFLLLASVSIPAVSAIPVANANPAICLAPAAVKFVVDGTAVALASATALVIAEHLGKTWDGTREGWEQLMKNANKVLSDLIRADNNWVDATSSEAKAVLEFDYHTAVSGSGDKKKDKLYHKAERDKKTDTVRIDTKRISEDDAVKEMKEGRDIFTSKKELAEKLVNRVSEENYNAKPNKFKKENRFEKLEQKDIEKHGNGKEGYYEHYHPKYQSTRPHCWWKEP